MLRESIGLNKKVLYCNLSGSNLIAAPVPNTIMELKTDSTKFLKIEFYIYYHLVQKITLKIKHKKRIYDDISRKTFFLIKKSLKHLSI